MLIIITRRILILLLMINIIIMCNQIGANDRSISITRRVRILRLIHDLNDA